MCRRRNTEACVGTPGEGAGVRQGRAGGGGGKGGGGKKLKVKSVKSVCSVQKEKGKEKAWCFVECNIAKI